MKEFNKQSASAHLQRLLNEDRKEPDLFLCIVKGHQWRAIGGRPCPRNPDANFSQLVYVCSICEEVDYGEKGGPGWNDCFVAHGGHGWCSHWCMVE